MAKVDRRSGSGSIKVLGRRRPPRGGLEEARALLDLVVRLRGDKPFIPRGLHRFESFEESEAWALRMMARPPRRDRPG